MTDIYFKSSALEGKSHSPQPVAPSNKNILILACAALLCTSGLLSLLSFEMGDHHNMMNGFSKLRSSLSCVKIDRESLPQKKDQ